MITTTQKATPQSTGSMDDRTECFGTLRPRPTPASQMAATRVSPRGSPRSQVTPVHPRALRGACGEQDCEVLFRQTIGPIIARAEERLRNLNAERLRVSLERDTDQTQLKKVAQGSLDQSLAQLRSRHREAAWPPCTGDSGTQLLQRRVFGPSRWRCARLRQIYRTSSAPWAKPRRMGHGFRSGSPGVLHLRKTSRLREGDDRVKVSPRIADEADLPNLSCSTAQRGPRTVPILYVHGGEPDCRLRA